MVIKFEASDNIGHFMEKFLNGKGNYEFIYQATCLWGHIVI